MSKLRAFDSWGRGFDMSQTQTGGGRGLIDPHVTTTFLGALSDQTAVFAVDGSPPLSYLLVSGVVDVSTYDAVITEIIFTNDAFDRLIQWQDVNVTINLATDFSQGFFYSILNADDSISGNQFSDIIKAGAGDDFVSGLGGNDRLFGEAGNDTLDGGLGFDAAVYEDAVSQYTLSYNQTRFAAADKVSGAIDRLTDIEKISFSDGSIDTSYFFKAASLSFNEIEMLTKLYVASFNRALDALGLTYWASRLAEGMTLPEIAKSFFVQPETISTYPTERGTEYFIDRVYANLFGRSPDLDGFAYWLQQIDQARISKDIFLLAVIYGAEAPTGGALDRQTLSHKAFIGMEYALEKGLSNVGWAYDVMSEVSFDDASLQMAHSKVDAYGIVASRLASGELVVHVDQMWGF